MLTRFLQRWRMSLRMFRLVRYVITGGINTILSYLVFACLIEIHINPYVSQAIGYIAGMMTSFFLNGKWTFSDAQLRFSTVFRFLIVNMALLGISNLFMYFILSYCTHSALIAQAVTLIPVTFFGYFLNRRFVFSAKPSEQHVKSSVKHRGSEQRSEGNGA